MVFIFYMYQVGFEMIDQISQEEGIPLSTIQSKALVGIGIYLVFVLLGSFFFLGFNAF